MARDFEILLIKVINIFVTFAIEQGIIMPIKSRIGIFIF